MSNREQSCPELEAPPPDLRDLTLWAGIVDRERVQPPLPQSRPWDGARVASPQCSILRPGRESIAELDTARQQRTIHLLIKPDILTCYRQHRQAPNWARASILLRQQHHRRPPHPDLLLRWIQHIHLTGVSPRLQLPQRDAETHRHCLRFGIQPRRNLKRCGLECFTLPR